MKSLLPRSCRSALCAGALALIGLTAANVHAALTWNTGGPSNNWNLTDTNWNPGGVAWTNGEDAVFSGTGETITVATVTANGLSFTGNSYTLSGGTLTLGGSGPIVNVDSSVSATISSNVAGTSGFTKEGAGTLTINTNTSNTITGTVTINAGTLSLINTTAPGSNTNKLATTTVVALGGGGLTYLGQDSGYNQIQDFAGLIINSGSSSMSVSRTGSASAFIRYTGNMTRSVGGTVDFSAGGGTAINTIGVTTNTHGIAGGFATFGGNTWAVYGLVNNGSMSGLALASYTAPALSTSAANVDVTASATLAGANSAANTLRFNTAAATTLTLNGAATITSGGILVTSAVGNNASTISGGTSLAGAAGQDLIVIQNNTSNSLTIATPIVNNTSATGLTKSGAGTLVVTGASTYSGVTTINTGILEIGGSGTLGSGAYAAAITNRATLRYNSSAAQSLSGVISGAGALTKDGSGVLTLSGANTYSGATTVNTGILQIGAGGTSGTLGTGAVSIANGATLAFNRSNAYTVAHAISGAGGVTQDGSGTLTFSTAKAYTGATIINAGTIEYTTNQTNATTYSGVGTVLLSSGVSNLNGSATFGSGFTGLINANSGGLINAFTVNMTANRGDLNVANAVQLAINSNNVQVDALTGAGSIVNQAVVTNAPAALTIGANNGNGGMAVFSGDITSSSSVNGRISIVKNGSGAQTLSGAISTGTGTMTVNAGTLILSGANSYTGVTSVNGGTLLVNGSLSSGGGAVTVANGAALGGAGTISRAVNIQSGGTLSPGNSPDQIFTGALTLASGSFYDVEIFSNTVGNGVTGYDQTVVTGAVSLSGAILNLLTVSGITIGDMFTIIDNDGADAVTGTFAGLAEGTVMLHGPYYMSITYVGGTGNDVVLEVTQMVPEPGSLTLCGLALAAGGWWTWRKRRRTDA